MCQVIADTPDELFDVAEHLEVELDFPIMISPRIRPWVLGLGAIELSRREFVEKLEEIRRFGSGSGPKREQLCR